MPRNSIRRSNRRSWTHEDLLNAVKTVGYGVSICKAAKSHGIPKRTLRRYLEKSKASAEVGLAPLGSFKTVFSEEQENQLVAYAIELSECLYGLTGREMRSLAFQMAEKNGICHPFDTELKLAGPDWLRSFLKRHPTLSLRIPENTSIARAKGFSRQSVARFFDLLEEIYDEHTYPPSKIWNVDETGVSTVQARNTKVLAKKGQHQVGRLVSAERGVNTTVTIAMSASGQYLPPFFIFPRQRMNDALKAGAPPESGFTCNMNGWSNTDAFSLWFDHFLSIVRPTAEEPVLLILDGHASHTRNLDVLEKAKNNHVKIISIPPHTSHKIQPLDVAFMGPFKSFYSNALSRLVKKNGGNPVTVYHTAGLVNTAFTEAGTLSVAQNGFRRTGIFPFNREVFSDADYAPSDFLKQTGSDPVSPAPETDTVNCPDQNEVDVMDISTFYFVDEQGNLSSLVVQEPDESTTQENEEVADRTSDSVDLPARSDTTENDEISKNSQPAVEKEHQPSSSMKVRTAVKGRRCKRTKPENQENILPSDAATPVKRRRWDKDFPMAENRSGPFGVPLLINDLNLRAVVQKPKKRYSGKKKEQSTDLTSSPYRKQLKQANALKDIKNIKKRPARKRKSKPDSKTEDTVCYMCGLLFSTSENGDGWTKCLSCQSWFHTDCQDSNDDMKCILCS